MIGRIGQRVAYGTLAIATLVGLFLVDAEIAAWVGGEDSTLSAVFGAAPAGGSAISRLFHRGSVIPIFILVMILRGAGELLALFQATGARPHRRFALLMVAALLVSPWFSAAGWLGSDVASQEGLYWSLVLLTAAILGAGVLQVLGGRPEGTFRDIGSTLFVVIYLGFLGSFALHIRCGADVPQQAGVWFLLMSVLIVKAADIGAFFAGSAIGRTKLCPQISPGKTVEGLVGGLAVSVAVAVLFAGSHAFAARIEACEVVVSATGDLTRLLARSDDPLAVQWGMALVFGLFLSAAGQCGDLLESCLKRDAGAKDSGDLIPEYGGILDLIDSAVLAMPVAWFFLTGVWSAG